MSCKSTTFLLFFLVILASLLLTGCDEFFTSRDPCRDDPDPNSCYMRVAAQMNSSFYCGKIGSQDEKADKSLISLKDECYSTVAMNTGDYSNCDEIVGGKDSKHTRDGCILSVATAKEDPVACTLLTGKSQRDCFDKLGSMIKISDFESLQEKIDRMEEAVRNNPRDRDLRDELKKLKEQKDTVYNNAPGIVQRDYFRQQREEILSSIYDEDVRRAIARDYIKYRNDVGEESITQLLEGLSEIKETQDTIKRIDEQANALIDKLKEGAIDYAKDGAGVVAEEGWKWAWQRSSEDMKWEMARLEGLKDKYDKASAQYQAINKKVQQFKKIYDEVNGVYKQVKKFDDLLAQGKIQEGHAEVLKGAVFLGKGLEYATAYVPVFGSTASTISKETFEVVVKLATQRAKRSTRLEDCFVDPANCDLDGITAY
ncbi:MAG TPA: hypothetical protein ENN46_02845 [Candidatus Woesearchaeota archaeon]|nr:hypothetical protein [Candidatus Woesearchaeota archaeon]